MRYWNIVGLFLDDVCLPSASHQRVTHRKRKTTCKQNSYHEDTVQWFLTNATSKAQIECSRNNAELNLIYVKDNYSMKEIFWQGYKCVQTVFISFISVCQVSWMTLQDPLPALISQSLVVKNKMFFFAKRPYKNISLPSFNLVLIYLY